jgi:hypothetical protein
MKIKTTRYKPQETKNVTSNVVLMKEIGDNMSTNINNLKLTKIKGKDSVEAYKNPEGHDMLLLLVDGTIIVNVQVEETNGDFAITPNFEKKEIRIEGKGKVHIKSLSRWNNCFILVQNGGSTTMNF